MKLNTTHTKSNAIEGYESEYPIRIKKLYKSFGLNEVLIDFNFDLPHGKTYAILGKSGSGKSVLIKCIIGLMKADSGTIHVFENNMTYLLGSELEEIRLNTGFLFQSNALYDSMTVRENLEFPLRRHGVRKSQEEVDMLVEETLSNVGLLETIDLMPAELSGGMQKRIALARTLILKPSIVLYDEPTTGLDPITAKEISHLIVKLREKYDMTTIVITHDLRCIQIVADKIVMLIDGTCYATGTYEVLKNSTDPKINTFFK